MRQQRWTGFLLSFIAILAVFDFPSVILCQPTCKALVLQGGGDKGAYEVGVLSGFISNSTNPEDFEYDVLTGISIGAINALAVSQFEKGEEYKAVSLLSNGWKNCTRQDIYINWPGGLLQGLFEKPSLFDNDPEKSLLQSWVEAIPDKRRVTVVATNLNTGEKVAWTEKDWQLDASVAVEAALLSSSVPFIFEYRTYENVTYVDGGWSGEGLDIEDAVFRCREIVDSDDQITIDVIMAGNVTLTPFSGGDINAFQMHSRYLDIKSYAGATRAYRLGRENFPSVNFRYVMISSEPLPNQDLPLDFKAKNIDFMINLGIKDAIDAMKEGPGVSAQRVYDAAVAYEDSLFFNTAN